MAYYLRTVLEAVVVVVNTVIVALVPNTNM